MTFDLHIHGETPAELLAALQQLNTSPLQQPQSEPVPQPEKSKAQSSVKPKRSAQKPAAAPAEEQQANPTNAPAQSAGAAATTTAPAAPELSAAAIQTTPAAANGSIDEPGKDPVTEDKIRSLIMALMKQGKTKECKAIITNAGAASISAIKPESYTTVWEQLCKLSEEVNQNAAE